MKTGKSSPRIRKHFIGKSKDKMSIHANSDTRNIALDAAAFTPSNLNAYMPEDNISDKAEKTAHKIINNRQKALLLLVLIAVFLIGICIAGIIIGDAAEITDFSRKKLPPSFEYPFGTDFMGRDMLLRTICGLSLSIRLGIVTATVSAIFAMLLGTLAAIGGKKTDNFITWLIDLLMGVPHILLLILISYACGKGFFGVFMGIVFTHWMSLARVIRGEILQLKESIFIKTAEKLGATKLEIAKRHILPHIIPQFTVGLILLFPHAILHEASITFLGFGLSAETPAIGIILSESMSYLTTGQWWTALFPGILLVITVLLFDFAGKLLRSLIDPTSAHK